MILFLTIFITFFLRNNITLIDNAIYISARYGKVYLRDEKLCSILKYNYNYIIQ